MDNSEQLKSFLRLPAKHAARFVGRSAAAKAGEDAEEGEDDEKYDDEGEVGGVGWVILGQAWHYVLA